MYLITLQPGVIFSSTVLAPFSTDRASTRPERNSATTGDKLREQAIETDDDGDVQPALF